MTFKEAEAVRQMIDGHWNLHMDSSTSELWLSVLIEEDPQEATAVVAHLAKRMHYAPKIVDFREVMRLLHPPAPVPSDDEELPPAKASKIPSWVRRWIAARYLYKRFGREQDMRPFREQAGMVDPLTTEWMPEDEWVTEGDRVTDADVWGAVRENLHDKRIVAEESA